MVITLDGPAASGKSTLARMIADRLRFFCLNSGMLYRAVASTLINNFSYSPENLGHVTVDEINKILDSSRFQYLGNGNIIFDGTDITSQLKTPAIDGAASILGTSAIARKMLSTFQRDITKKRDVVAEGRDAGSVVFPAADIKFYVIASPQTRAKRYRDYQDAKGITITQEEALHTILMRDARDTERHISPLVVPNDAIVIDNTLLSPEQTLALILSYIKK